MDNGRKERVSSLFGFLIPGWAHIDTPSKARCNAYERQVDYAQEQLKRDNLSRKDKKFWRKERNAGMNGLADVHNSNNETFVKIIWAVGAGLVIGNKLLNSKK